MDLISFDLRVSYQKEGIRCVEIGDERRKLSHAQHQAHTPFFQNFCCTKMISHTQKLILIEHIFSFKLYIKERMSQRGERIPDKVGSQLLAPPYLSHAQEEKGGMSPCAPSLFLYKIWRESLRELKLYES